MFLEKVFSEGLAHFSYVLGDNGRAAVIDPQVDVDIYLDIALENKCRITHVFETHRNEDFVSGSMELQHQTGADIYHGRQLAFQYGRSVKTGDRFEMGDLVLKILETPGHTYESVCLVVSDASIGDTPVAVFTGDTLFVGDVGRTDFFPDKAEEVAGLLYDSIFEKLIPLGDQVIIYPAHGAGSVCGVNMADREFSTIGVERMHNPVLQKTRKEDFVRYKVNERHYKPKYFKQMEKYNLEGPPVAFESKVWTPFTADELKERMQGGMVILDVRSAEACAGAHIPGSLVIPLEMIPAFAGYFLQYEQPIGLVVNDARQAEQADIYLGRLGYDTVQGYLESGMQEWETKGRRFDTISAVHVEILVDRIKAKEAFTLLDVRTIDEFESGHLPNATHIYVGELEDRIDEVPMDRPVTTFCGSGLRAVIAASILKRRNITEVEVCLGSMKACMSYACPVVKEETRG